MKPALSKYMWFNGEYVSAEEALVPVTTHAIHYGTSVFEGIRAYWNGQNLNVFRLPEHVERFRRSGQFYNIRLNYTDGEITDAITGICTKNRLERSCYIRPFYFVGEYGINLNVTCEAPTNVAIFAFPFGDLFSKEGITAGISSWRKFSDMSTPVQAKVGGNYLNSVIATQDAKRMGVDEAILLDHEGNVSEAPGENIFIVRDRRLATPPLSSSALDGITRDAVIRMAAELGVDAEERIIRKDELLDADEIFLTGTAAEITPVVSVDSRRIGGGGPGETTKTLMRAYSDVVMGANPDYAHWLTAVY